MKLLSYFLPVPEVIDTFITSFLFIIILLKIFSILLPFFRPNIKFQLALALLVATYNAVWLIVKMEIVRLLYPFVIQCLPLPVIDILLLCIDTLIMYYLIVKLVL